MEYREQVPCPLVGREITAVECIEACDVVDGLLLERVIPPEFTSRSNWEAACLACPYHDKATA